MIMLLFSKLLIGSSCILNLFLALVVIRRKKIKANYAFILLALITSGWNFANVLLLFNPTLFNLRLSYALGSLVLAASLGWVVHFAKYNSKITIISYSVGFINFGLSLSPLIIKKVIKFVGAGQLIEYGPLFNYFSLYFIGILVLVAGFLVFALSKPSTNKNHIKFILFGLLLFGFFALFFNTILPLFKMVNLMNLDSTSAMFFIGFSAYAIIKHRLMDIRALLLKSVAYSITLAMVVGGYVALTVIVFQRLEDVINHTALDIITLLTLVYTFNPLRKFIENHTDRFFAKGRYNFNELLGQFGEITKQNSRSIAGLSAKVLETLTKEMRINKAAFILTNSPEPAHIRTLGFESKSKHLWSKPTKLVFDTGQTIVYDELDEEAKEKEIMRNVGAEVLIPIKTDQETEGILALGEKGSGDMYTAQDLNLLELVAPQIAIALENAKSFKDKEQRIAELKSINKMFRHIEHFLDLDNLLQKIVDEAISVTGAEGGSVMLLNKTGTSLSIKTARSLSPVISLNAKIKIGEGIAGKVALTRKPLILNGFRDNRFKDHLRREDIASAISVPMMAGDHLIGVLNVNRKKLRVEFTKENLNVMGAFAAQAAEAISKAGYYHQIEKLSIKNDNQFKEFTKALAKTVDAKDPYTYGHSEAVTNYAMEIAKEMGVSNQQMRTLEIGGRLHDMGKIGVPEHILNKPAGLTDDEYKAIQRHPEIGARILKDTSSLKSIRDLILYHHERFDGRGYPANLKGKNIPLLARILAVADTYDAMTSHRAYRKALSRKIAVEEIEKNSGSQFDPEIVKAFMRVMDKKRFKVIKNTIHQTAFIDEVKFGLDETAE